MIALIERSTCIGGEDGRPGALQRRVKILDAAEDDPGLFGRVIYSGPVFVKHVVRRFHAASLISGVLISVSGLSQTGPAGCQLRVLPDQRSGFCARAFA